MNGSRVILAAHRGDRKNCPENTMPAFESALHFGVDMIETDVRMTKDGALVLTHDLSLKRITGVCGQTNEWTLDEIRTLDAGAYFSPEFQNTPIPTVEELIALIKDSDMLVNWELKDYPKDVGEKFAFETADKLIALIQKHGLEKRSMINSFSDRVLEHIYTQHGSAFSIHGQGIFYCQKTNDRAAVPQEELYDWCCLYPNEAGLRPLDFPENFEYCKKHGILPCVCVPDELETYRQYVALGCRMFTSNDIYAADSILRDLKLRK